MSDRRSFLKSLLAFPIVGAVAAPVAAKSATGIAAPALDLAKVRGASGAAAIYGIDYWLDRSREAYMADMAALLEERFWSDPEAAQEARIDAAIDERLFQRGFDAISYRETNVEHFV